MNADLRARLAARKRALIPAGFTEESWKALMLKRANVLVRKAAIEAKVQASKAAVAPSVAPTVAKEEDVILTSVLAQYGAQLSDDEVLLAKYVSPLTAPLAQRYRRVMLIRDRAKAAKMAIPNIIQMFMLSKDVEVLEKLKISAQEWMA